MNEYTVDLIDKSKLFRILSGNLSSNRYSEDWKELPVGARVLLINPSSAPGMLTTVVQSGDDFACQNPNCVDQIRNFYMFHVEPVIMKSTKVEEIARTRRLPDEIETRLQEYLSKLPNLLVPRRLFARNPLAAIAQWYIPVVQLLDCSELAVAIYVRRADTGELLLSGGNFAGVTSLHVEMRTVTTNWRHIYDMDGEVPQPSMMFRGSIAPVIGMSNIYCPIELNSNRPYDQLPSREHDFRVLDIIAHMPARHAPLQEVWMRHPRVSDNDNVLIEAIAQVPRENVQDVFRDDQLRVDSPMQQGWKMWRWMQQATSFLTNDREDSVLIIFPFSIKRTAKVIHDRFNPACHCLGRVRSDVTGSELGFLSQVSQGDLQVAYISSSSLQVQNATIPADRSLSDVIDVQDVLVHTPIYVRTKRQQENLIWPLLNRVEPSARRVRGEQREDEDTVAIRMPGTSEIKLVNTSATSRALGLVAPVTFVNESDMRAVVLNQFDPIGTLTPTTDIWSVAAYAPRPTQPEIRGGRHRHLGAHHQR